MSQREPFEPPIRTAEADLGPAERRRVTDVLSSGRLSNGPQVEAFADELATACDVEHAVPASTGTTALHAGLAALDIGPGDAVVIPGLAPVRTANAVKHVGAEPVVADVDPRTYTLDPENVEKILIERADVDAVLAVHLFGLPAAMDPLATLAERHDVALIEDASEALGGSYRCTPVGSVGDIGIFDFGPGNIVTVGEGGAVITDDDAIAKAVRQFGNEGRAEDGDCVVVGHNFRMTDLAAAIGCAQLSRLDDRVATRRQNAARFEAAISDEGPITPAEPMGRVHAYNHYTLRTPRRESFREHLRRYGVETAIPHAKAIHHQPAYRDVDAHAPTATEIASEIVSLPVHPNLRETDVRAICGALEDRQP